MKKHMITHSYKEAKFKCDDCDFVGQNLVSIEVHVRRNTLRNMNVACQEYGYANHFKLDRNNSSEISERSIKIDIK